MLWLDTSVLADLGKLAKGQAIEKLRAAKLTSLQSVVKSAVRAERLICPEWDQSLEYELLGFKRNTQSATTNLSYGVHCLPLEGVRDAQVMLGIDAYFKKANEIKVPWTVNFGSDPMDRLRAAKRQGFIIDVDLEKPKEWLRRAKVAKSEVHVEWEAIRLQSRQACETFEERLGKERLGDSSTMITMVEDWFASKNKGGIDIWKYFGVIGFLSYASHWQKLTNEPSGLAAISAIYSYMRSPYYWELPIQDVSCRLITDLVTRGEQIKSGDAQDVNHLSLAIPLAQFLVADKAMVARCRRTAVDTKWGAKLFVTKTLDDLCDEIQTL